VKEPRFLVMQLARLGDLVQSWPLLRRLRWFHPGAGVGVLCDRRWTDLMQEGPAVAEVLGLDLPALAGLAERDWPGAYEAVRKTLEALRQRRYDRAYVLNLARPALLLIHLLGVEARGYRPLRGGREVGREPWLSYIFSLVHGRACNRVHLSDVFRHLVVEPESEPPPLPPTMQHGGREPVVALQLGTRHRGRTWPLASFGKLAELLAADPGARLFLTGTGAERPWGERLRQSLPPALRQRVENLQGRTTLPQLAERLREADLLVSGDTGTLHLAAALGVRVLGLYHGPARCFETGPYGAGHLVLQAEPPCHPCREGAEVCDAPRCSTMVTPELAARAARFALEDGGRFAGGLAPYVHLYGSAQDAFGNRFESLGGDEPRFTEVMGEAYRRAGAGLLGYPDVAGPTAALQGEELEMAGIALEALHRGVAPPGMPDTVAGALGPLRAFRWELAAQAGDRWGEEQQRRWERVAGALRNCLEQACRGRGAMGEGGEWPEAVDRQRAGTGGA